MAITYDNWIIGLSVMIALTVLLTYMTYRDLETFFIWLTVFSGFMVWSGLLDLWILILCMFILSMMMINIIYRKRGLE